MAIGVSSYAYRWAVQLGRLDPFSLLDRSHKAGAEVVQICENLPLDRLPGKILRDLAREATELGLILEIGIKGSHAEHLRHSLDIARPLGVRLFRLVLTEDGGKTPLAEFEAIIKSIVPVLHATGVTLAIENHFELHPAELAQLIKAINDPLVGVCLDPLNSLSRLVGPAETIAILATLAVSVHIKDGRAMRQNTGFYIGGCPLGEGLLDVPGLLMAVRTAGQSPNLLVESWMDRLDSESATLTQEEAWVSHGIAYLRQLSVNG